MAEEAVLNAGLPKRCRGSVLACVSAGGMSLMLAVAASDIMAALSLGRSLFIDIFLKKPHLPPVLDELAVRPVEGAARFSSIGELIRLPLLLLVILARREDDDGGSGMPSDSARTIRRGGVGVARSDSLNLLNSEPADLIRRISDCDDVGVNGAGAAKGADCGPSSAIASRGERCDMDGVAEIGEFMNTESVDEDATISRTDGVELMDDAMDEVEAAARIP